MTPINHITDRERELSERVADLESRLQSLAQSVMSDHVSDDSHSLFIAAIRDLAAISEALECDPDDGGAVPIIEAIDALKADRDDWIACHAKIFRELQETKARVWNKCAELDAAVRDRDELKAALTEVAYANRTRATIIALAKKALHGGQNG